jgi:DNA-directed RNA polymerase specialized sigma subunit
MTVPVDQDPCSQPPSDAELEELVQRFDHRVKFFARGIEVRFGLGMQWRDDLISAGYWGLLKALRNRRADAHEHELSAYVSRRTEGSAIARSIGVNQLVAVDGHRSTPKPRLARSRPTAACRLLVRVASLPVMVE